MKALLSWTLQWPLAKVPISVVVGAVVALGPTPTVEFTRVPFANVFVQQTRPMSEVARASVVPRYLHDHMLVVGWGCG
jgi:hypothetical protein